MENHLIKDNEKDEIIGEVNFNTDESETTEYHYIAVVFEDNLNKGHFRGNSYNYKTMKDLKEGQVITVPTKFGSSKACVTDPNVDASTILFDLDKIKEV